MILLIDNYDSFTYNLYQVLASIKNTVQVFRNDKITIDNIQTLKPNGIILSPGPGRPENAGICVEVIQQLSKDIPILGVCLGHQAIATALGGDVISASEIIHGKSSVIFHHRSALYDYVPLPFTAGRYHSLVIDRNTLPNDLIIESETGDGMIMGVKHKNYPLYGVQFHPESILSEHGPTILKNFMKICGEMEC